MSKRLQPAVGQKDVDCPMSRAVRPKASKVPPGRNGWIRPRAAVELLGKLSFNVLAQGREAGLPAERPSGAVG